MSTPTSPKPPRDLVGNYSASAAVQHSPYHVLAQLTAAISSTAETLLGTHQQFVAQQAGVFEAGVGLRSVVRDVQAGIEAEKLALVVPEVDGNAAGAFEGEDEDVESATNGHKSRDVSASAGQTQQGQNKRKKLSTPTGAAAATAPKDTNKNGTSSIYSANNSRGVSDTDPIVID